MYSDGFGCSGTFELSVGTGISGAVDDRNYAPPRAPTSHPGPPRSGRTGPPAPAQPLGPILLIPSRPVPRAGGPGSRGVRRGW